jgi:hypothetical protein
MYITLRNASYEKGSAPKDMLTKVTHSKFSLFVTTTLVSFFIIDFLLPLFFLEHSCDYCPIFPLELHLVLDFKSSM